MARHHYYFGAAFGSRLFFFGLCGGGKVAGIRLITSSRRVAVDHRMFDMSDLDSWLGSRSPGTAAQLHAVGAFALYYNDLELALYGFFRRYLPQNRDARAFLYVGLHNRARVDLVRTLLSQEPIQQLRDGGEHALACFDICAENRNLLLHAMTHLDGPSAEHLRVTKIGKGEKGGGRPKFSHYAFSLESIRQAALDMRTCEDYIALLLRPDAAIDSVWPPKPPLPRKLSLSRLPEADESDQPASQTSRG